MSGSVKTEGSCRHLNLNGTCEIYDRRDLHCIECGHRHDNCIKYPTYPIRRENPKCGYHFFDVESGAEVVEIVLNGLKLQTADGSVVDPILYCHQETTIIGGSSYYLQKRDISADASGTTLTASTGSVARVVWGKFVFQLTSVTKILAATIYATYRAYTGGGTVNAEIDIIIRKNDGTIRTTIAIGVSKSGNLGSSWATYTGANYSYAEYTVIDQTDWLEIDYIANVTVKKSGQTAYLRIDDNTLATGDQTRSQSWVFQMSLTVTDGIGASETPRIDKTSITSDGIGLSDVSLRDKGLLIADQVSLADQSVRDKTLTSQDNVILADFLLRDKGLIISDQVGSMDVLSSGKNLLVLDQMNIQDLAHTLKTLLLSDGLGLVDQAIRDKAFSILESMVITDQAIRDKGITILDTVTFSEVVEKTLQAILKEIADSVHLGEIILSHKTLTSADTITSSELIAILITKTVSDILGMADVIRTDKVLLVWEGITLSDLITKDRLLQILDVSGVSDYVLVDKLLTLVETITVEDLIRKIMPFKGAILTLSHKERSLSPSHNVRGIMLLHKMRRILSAHKERTITISHKEREMEVKHK